MISPSLSMKKKMTFVLAFLFVLGFTVLIGRLVKLQFVDGNFYQQKALSQQLSVTTITANRGTIYDRNMKPLAQSATVWDVYVSPSYIKADKDGTVEEKLTKISTGLAKILNLDEKTVYSKISKKTSYVVIAKKVENDVATLVRNFAKDNKLSCIGIVEDSKRYYPFNNFASQLIGFTGSDNQGLAGVEAYYNSVLKGVNGRVVTAKNAKGTDMPYDFQDRVEAKDGTSIVLTIDEVVQHYLEKNLQSAYVDNNVGVGVTGIVMDVKTGEILAMSSQPSFDPNNPFEIANPTVQQKIAALSGDEQKTQKSLAQQDQWRNNAITNPYEPGSTFKIITAAAALNEGVVKETDEFDDPGSINVAGTDFHCWKRGGHGHQTFLQGFENSCNVVFIKVGQALGVNRLYKYITAFGLTQKTGIDLPGEADSISLSESKMGPVELASVSFGQSNKITPIQLISAVSAVANGGKLVQPHIVKEQLDQNNNIVKTFGTTEKRQVISEETSKEMCTMMEKEVEEGTGNNAYVAGYRIGGKTGTAQKLEKGANSDALVCSMVGIAPADDPQIAVLVLFDEPHAAINFGGVITAPVLGKIMSEVLPYLGVEPQYTAEEQEKLDVKTPNLVGMSTQDAESQLKNDKLNQVVIGSGAKVTAQVPETGRPIPRGGKVILYTDNAQVQDTITVPNVTGLTVSQANNAIVNQNLNIELVGNGLSDSGVKAFAQNPAAGSKVSPGTVITVQFRNEDVKVQ
ncbi:MAG TPA: penicillin-binding transpeptidase domain-containing protein [Ruminiclostridium sp.]|nr:penicillin-binding transpeptidase domain-containing protein [Ruminiclostridium sp.]